MATSPWAGAILYRNRRRRVIVILAALGLLLPQGLTSQSAARRAKVSKGPRALGLLQFTPNGKAYLIPVVIMYDGEFYDASAYKAAPVPMALDSGIVYEAVRTGVSQGLFTVRGALRGPNNTWKAEGSWLPEGAKPANAPHKAEAKPRDIEPEDGPPVLRRKGSEPEKPAEAAPQPAAPVAAPSPAPVAAPAASAPAPAPLPAEADRDQPVLRRGKPAPVPEEALPSPAVVSAKSAATAQIGAATKTGATAVQMIPAISDAGGPEPRPYAYSAKPEDEEQMRKKILALAADEIRAREQQLAAAMVGAPPPAASQRRKPSPAAKPPQPEFEDVQLRIFDLSFSNEPVLVLMAKARMPQKSNVGAPGVQYLLTLVVRQDIYGDLHKALSNVTDTQHLDVIPQMDLIDAVDVDGDGRGELLFRKTSDAGTAYSVYRVIGNQLWPLFEGTPQ